LVLCLFAIYRAASNPEAARLLQPSVDILKLILTASAGWGLIVLYASSNSQNRISKETSRFFHDDVMGAFRDNGFSTVLPAHEGFGVELVKNKAGTAIFALSSHGKTVLLFWCRLNVYELSIVF